VQPTKLKNIWRDCVNIPEAHRKDARGERIKEGTICKIAADGGTTRVYVKGILGETKPIVKMDEKTRNDLGVVVGTEYEFELTKAGCWGQLLWAWDATDPVARIAARSGLILGGLSVVLGVIGLVLGLLAYFATSPK
ncbi:MAG TPA: hypothetical protein VI837_11800, partial [Blastocatellia bacterium]|nr:hypothetical protein [Blastocatellia bacterium]